MKITFNKLNKNLTKDSKILCLTHNDMDGAGSVIVLKSYFNNLEFIECKYSNVDNIFDRAYKRTDIDFIFITDISVKTIANYPNKNYVMLDHHESAKELHDPENNRYVYAHENVSGTLLTFMFCNFLFGKPKYDIYSLVEIINDYDLWHLKHPESMNMNRLYFTIFGRRFIERFKYGFTSYTLEEIKILNDIQKDFDRTWDELEIMEFKKEGVIVTYGTDFISEMCDKIIKELGAKIVVWKNYRTKVASVRSSVDSGFNVGAFLQEHEFGGGHANAGGFAYNCDEDFKMKVEVLLKTLR